MMILKRTFMALSCTVFVTPYLCGAQVDTPSQKARKKEGKTSDLQWTNYQASFLRNLLAAMPPQLPGTKTHAHVTQEGNVTVVIAPPDTAPTGFAITPLDKGHMTRKELTPTQAQLLLASSGTTSTTKPTS